MRVAKIVCTSGEYVCIVKDISSTGARLRFLHEQPADQQYILEMANGFRCAMQCMWRQDAHAGFRFSREIDVEDFLDDAGSHGRPEVRVKLEIPARIAVKSKSCDTILIDLSQNGACILLSEQIAEQQLVLLSVDGLNPRFGHIRWRKGQLHGLVLQQGLNLTEFANFVHAARSLAEALQDNIAKHDQPLAQLRPSNAQLGFTLRAARSAPGTGHEKTVVRSI